MLLMEELKVIKRKFKKDLIYIKKDMLSKQKNGKYLKWSRLLKAVSLTNVTQSSYINYWTRQYESYPDEIYLKCSKEITDLCNDKFENHLIDSKVMIKMIANSNDFESEKKEAIKLLGGKYKINKKKHLTI